MEDEWNMKAFDYITKAQRVMKAVEGKYRNDDDFRSLQHLSTFECGIRSGEMWETLMAQYSGSASMIDKHITVRDLRAKISQTSVAHLGSLNATHPPMQSYTHHIRARAGFNDLCRRYWEDADPERYCADPNNRSDEKIMEICTLLTKIMRCEARHYGYALRRYNSRYAGFDESKMIITQHVLEDWVSMRYDLALERSAAVVHLQGIVSASTLLHKWTKFCKEQRVGRPAYDYVLQAFGELKSSIDLRDDMWEIGGYQVMMADQRNFIAVEMRNRMFSCTNDYITTTSASQIGQGSSDVRHIAAWDKPLLLRDTRWPPAEVKPPFWDPKPVQMMTKAQLHAALAEMGEQVPPEPLPKAMPKRPEPKPMPKPAAAPSSSSTGSSTKPKARPESSTQTDAAPDWIIMQPPAGYLFRQFTNPDYRDTMITASLWQDTYGQLLLSVMQGPIAANPAINVWSQCLRRIAAYGCMIFGVCSPRVVYEEDAAKIPEDDWLKLYSHINRTYALAKRDRI